MQRTGRHRRYRGMTLIEIMVVITLLGLVAAAVGVSAMRIMVEGQISAARAQAFEISKAVDTYRVMFGRYPSASEGLAVLTTTHGNKPPLMDRLPRDPWDRAFLYANPGVKIPSKFDVRSHGPDGVEGGNDDVGNWPEWE